MGTGLGQGTDFVLSRKRIERQAQNSRLKEWRAARCETPPALWTGVMVGAVV